MKILAQNCRCEWCKLVKLVRLGASWCEWLDLVRVDVSGGGVSGACCMLVRVVRVGASGVSWCEWCKLVSL